MLYDIHHKKEKIEGLPLCFQNSIKFSMMKNILKGATLLMLMSVVACKDNTKANEQPSTEEPQHQEETVIEDTRFKVEIESNDQMQFDKKELKVPVGEPVVLTLTHSGKMDKSVMGHNFVLLKQGVELQAFAEKAALAADTEYIPVEEEGNVLAHTKVVGGGESDTIEFVITEAGKYEFLCTFPGHYAIMRGVLIVE